MGRGKSVEVRGAQLMCSRDRSDGEGCRTVPEIDFMDRLGIASLRSCSFVIASKVKEWV